VEIAAAAQTGRFGVPWTVVEGLRRRSATPVRVVGQVPPSVTGPGPARRQRRPTILKLDGNWVGTEREAGSAGTFRPPSAGAADPSPSRRLSP
jgi:hypothetical protein